MQCERACDAAEQHEPDELMLFPRRVCPRGCDDCGGLEEQAEDRGCSELFAAYTACLDEDIEELSCAASMPCAEEYEELGFCLIR